MGWRRWCCLAVAGLLLLAGGVPAGAASGKDSVAGTAAGAGACPGAYRALTHALMGACRDGVVINALDGRTLDANPAYLQVLGYSLEEIRRLTYQQLTPARWHAMEERLFQRVLRRGFSGPYRKEYIHKDGTVFPVRVQAWLIRDDQGRPWRLLGIVRDLRGGR